MKIARGRFRRFLWFVIALSLVVDVACLAFSRTAERKESVSMTPTPRAPQASLNSAWLSVDSLEHDFGIVTQQSSLDHRFKMTNTGKQPLEILSVEASCGCTSTLLSEQTLQPGESGELKVNFESGSMEGPFRKKVTIFTNAAEPTTEIAIKGTVQPLYTVDPAMVAFGKVRPGSEYRRTVVIQARRDDTPFDIARIRALDPQIEIENIQNVKDQRRTRFDVVFRPIEGGWEQGSISFETGHPAKPREYVRYSGKRQP
jgi:hypothetical protein